MDICKKNVWNKCIIIIFNNNIGSLSYKKYSINPRWHEPNFKNTIIFYTFSAVPEPASRVAEISRGESLALNVYRTKIF